MALIAEIIVEEWLTRQGYFTIRGLKGGVDEIDILAAKNENGIWKYLHVEVQVSIRPVSYFTGLSQSRQIEFNIKGKNNAKTRSNDQLQLSVSDWVHKKFFAEKKVKIRTQLSHNANWKYLFVFGNIRHSEELEHIRFDKRIEVKGIKEIITELKNNKFEYTTVAGADLIDLMTL